MSDDERPPIGSRVSVDGEPVTVVPTGRRVPRDEVNVMGPGGSIRTVRLDWVSREQTEAPEFPPFGGWTPTDDGDHCKGGHPGGSYDDLHGHPRCHRCGRRLDLRRCLCGEHTGDSMLARSDCPRRMRQDQRDAEEHWAHLTEAGRA